MTNQTEEPNGAGAEATILVRVQEHAYAVPVAVLEQHRIPPEQQAELAAAGSSFPTREGALTHLDGYAAGHSQWNAAISLLDYAHTEPAFPSCDSVRWVVGDVGTQVFRYYFTADRIPATLELMDNTAAELHARNDN